MSRHHREAVVALSLGLVLTACSGGDGGAVATAPPSSAPTVRTTAELPTPDASAFPGAESPSPTTTLRAGRGYPDAAWPRLIGDAAPDPFAGRRFCPPEPPRPDVHTSPDPRRTAPPADAVLVVSCGVVERVVDDPTVAGRVQSWYVEEHATDHVDRLQDRLSLPDMPAVGDVVCNASETGLPWFLVVGADGQAVLPRLPKDECDLPPTFPFETMRWTEVAAVPLGEPRRAPRPSGCAPADVHRVAASQAAGPHEAFAEPVLRGAPHVLCVYGTVAGTDGERAVLTAWALVPPRLGEQLTEALARPPAARECAMPASSYAVLHRTTAGSRARVVVELDGCARVLRRGPQATGPMPEVVALVESLPTVDVTPAVRVEPRRDR